MTKKSENLSGGHFGRLLVLEKRQAKRRSAYLCRCDCGRFVVVKGIYLKREDTQSCGCLKKEQEKENLREQYDNKRIHDVVMPLFKGQEPRRDSSTGYRGVMKYYTRKSKELRYRAWITVKGKKYYKSGFRTPEEAYFEGRLQLEKEHLPNQ